MPTPRVAYLTSWFPAPTETFILNELRGVLDMGLDVDVFPLFGAAKGPRHPGTDAVLERTHYMPLVGILLAQLHWLRERPRAYLAIWWRAIVGHLRAPLDLLKTLLVLPRAMWIAREIRRRGIPHVHAHWATHPALVAWVIRRLTGASYSFTAHAHDLYLHHAMLPEKVREARMVVTISEFNRRLIGALCGTEGERKTRVIRCGVDPDSFRRPETPVVAEGPPLVLCVAGLRDYKGQVHLVDACAALRDRGVSFRCVIVGEGPERGRLLRRIGERWLGRHVELAGALPQDRVRQLVREAQVVVHPSVVTPSGMMDGIPVAIMEAMAAECAVVTTRVSGIPELVKDGESGLLVQPEDPAGLAAAVERLLGDPALRVALGAGARKAVLERFTLQENVALLHRELARAAVTHVPEDRRTLPGLPAPAEA